MHTIAHTVQMPQQHTCEWATMAISQQSTENVQSIQGSQSNAHIQKQWPCPNPYSAHCSIATVRFVSVKGFDTV